MNDSLSEWPVTVTLPVVWGEMDSFSHVNNAVYFRYFESARIAYFEALGYTEHMAQTGKGPILAETSCRYRRPLTYPDTITVGVRVAKLEEDRFLMEYSLWSHSQETTAARGTGLVVSYDYRASKRCILPESIREAIVALEAGGAD